MRINPSQFNAYARDISRPAARAGSVVDLTATPGRAPVPSGQPLSGPRATEEVGTIQGVLTPEESRFIAGLFPRRDGQDERDPRAGYTYAGRPVSGSIPGIRLDLKA